MVSSSEFHFVSQTHIDFLSSSSSNNKMERLSPPSSCNAKLINKRLKPRVSRGRRAQNQDESQPKRSSIYRGVTKHRWTGRYEAHLWDKHCWNPVQNKKGRQVYLGAYDDEKAAAHTYDLAALKYWGTETILNFPVSTYANEYQEMQNLSKEEYLASLRRRSSGFSRGASKYRGVAKHHHNGRWEARIGRVYGNKYLYLGTFDTQEDAATAYDLAALEYRGPNAVTNFEISRYIKRQPQNQTPQHPQLFNHQPQSHTQQHPQLFNHLLVQQTEPQHELVPLPEINEQPIITQGFESQIVADPIVFENYNEPNWNMCLATCFNEYTNIEINRANDLYNFLRNDGFTDNVENIFDGCGTFGCDMSVNAATAGSASASAIDYGDGGILNNPETVDGVFVEVGEGVTEGGAPEVNSGSYPFAISIYS